MEFNLTITGEVNAENAEILAALISAPGAKTKSKRTASNADTDGEEAPKEKKAKAEKVKEEAPKEKPIYQQVTEFLTEKIVDEETQNDLAALLKDFDAENLGEVKAEDLPDFFKKAKKKF